VVGRARSARGGSWDRGVRSSRPGRRLTR
jgi:hypothetical protein